MNRSRSSYGSADNDNDNDNDNAFDEFRHDLESFSSLLGKRSFDSSNNDLITKRSSREYQSLSKDRYNPYNIIVNNFNLSIGILGFVIALILIIIILTTTKTSNNNTEIITVDNNIDFTIKKLNYEPLEYFTSSSSSSSSSSLKYSHLDSYIGIIEPYGKSVLHINRDNNYDDISYYTYSMCLKSLSSSSSSSSSCESGILFLNSDNDDIYVSNKCNPYDEYTIKVTGYNDDDDVISTGEGVCLCTYVRREIRDINADDLSNIIDAMYTLWSTSDNEGSIKYGSDFHSHLYFSQLHDFNSAWRDADHLHEGAGFLLQSVKISNMFELAMQAVDQSVSLPYWDYTIEGESNVLLQDSIIVGENVFGNASAPVSSKNGFTYEFDTLESGAISTGRWAFFEMDKMENTISSLKSGYGYLRSPWSMNPSPYLSRFALSTDTDISLPSCSSHYDVLTETSMMSFFNNIQYEPHLSTHMIVGGVFGCDKLNPFVTKGYMTSKDMYNICLNWPIYLKELYRDYNIIPNQDCLVAIDNVKNSNCGFECVHDTKDTSKSTLQEFLSNYVSDDIANDESNLAWDEFVDFVCTGDGQKIYPGDSYQSSSPSDPIHWVIYPTLERLFHAKLISGGFENESWVDDSNVVCERAECYSPFSPELDYYDECCDGHYSNSQLLDHTIWNRCSYFGDTNAATLSSLDPRKDYALPYIYDDMKWSHCSSSVDIDSLLSSFSTTSRLLNVDREKGNDDGHLPTVLPTLRPTHKPTTMSPIESQTKSFC